MIQPCLQWLAINASTRNTFIDSLITIGRPYNFPWPLSYPADAMENNLDWINVMAFDFGAPTWKPNLTEAPAALYNPFSEAIAKFVCYWRALRPLTGVFRLIFQKFVCLS